MREKSKFIVLGRRTFRVREKVNRANGDGVRDKRFKRPNSLIRKPSTTACSVAATTGDVVRKTKMPPHYRQDTRVNGRRFVGQRFVFDSVQNMIFEYGRLKRQS